MPRPDRTLADAHRDHALGLEMARVGLELARLNGQPTPAHEEAVARSREALVELGKLEAPPADLEDFATGKMASWRSSWARSQELWEKIENQDPTAPFLHPRETRRAQEGAVDAVEGRITAGRFVEAIDAIIDSPLEIVVEEPTTRPPRGRRNG